MQRAPLKRGSPACSAVFAHASAPAESLIRFALTWVKNAARQGGEILAGPLSGTLLLPPPHQSSQRQGCTDPGDERAVRKPPCEGSLREFFLFSSKAAFLPSFFFSFFFHPHLFEGFNCLTSGTSSTLHWPSGKGCAVY